MHTYNAFVIIPDLRKTGIKTNMHKKNRHFRIYISRNMIDLLFEFVMISITKQYLHVSPLCAIISSKYYYFNLTLTTQQLDMYETLRQEHQNCKLLGIAHISSLTH